jgi:hypothetical protein
MIPSQFMRDDTAKQYKKVRKLLSGSDYDSGKFYIKENQKERKVLFVYIVLGLLAWALLFWFFYSFDMTQAKAYTEQEAVQTIVGEASNQGFTGMVAVAEVIRHSKNLKGFYGLHAAHNAHEPVWVWQRAQLAWAKSKYTNLTKGANHFENIHSFGCPYWIKSCVETFRWKDHIFFREII